MSEREWRFYIDDMLPFAEKVRTCSEGIDRATFEQDELKYDAILTPNCLIVVCRVNRYAPVCSRSACDRTVSGSH